MALKNLIKNIGVKGIFNAVFPKAENSKVGQFVSGVLNGSTAGIGSFLKDFIQTMFDTNKDGVINLEDFKGMSAKTYGMGVGLILLVAVISYLLGIV